MCPFQIVYGFVARAPTDLLPLPSSVQNNLDATQHAKLILKLHTITKENIERMNVKYKVDGDIGRKHVVFEVVILFCCICAKTIFLICTSLSDEG
jgi:hypothetical protein